MSKAQIATLFDGLMVQVERSTVPLVSQSRHLKLYIDAQRRLAEESASNAVKVKACYLRAQDALRMRSHAQVASDLRLKYLGSKLPKHEVIRRTAGHVGLGLPKTPQERAEDLRRAMHEATAALDDALGDTDTSATHKMPKSDQ